MGRSVSIPQYAELVCFQQFICEEGYEEYEEWLDYEYGIVSQAADAWPSLEACSEWIGHSGEDHAKLKNKFGWFGISEYAGIVSIWFVPNDEDPLAVSWCRRIAPRFSKLFSRLEKLSTASNGESSWKEVTK